MKAIAVCLLLAASLSASAQLRNADVYEMTELNQGAFRNVVTIPGFDGYQTLKCDFHIHTVFSDGSVWPDIRVEEAWQEGLDAIAITDHIEYRPHKDVLKGDLNESYRIAKRAGDSKGLIVIHGTEITRSKPLGHLNALFINDAMPMDVEDPLVAIDEAKKQGAFILWNHPGWPDDKSTLYPVHEKLLKSNKIDGIEVVNHLEYYPLTFDWCTKYNKAFVGNTDIHGLIAGTYGWGDRPQRPLTLVFATSRSQEAIKEAMFAGRTAVLFDNQLVGPEKYLTKLIKASFTLRSIGDRVEVTNISDIPYRVKVDGKLLLLPARKSVIIGMPQSTSLEVENCYVGHEKRLTMSLYDFADMLR